MSSQNERTDSSKCGLQCIFPGDTFKRLIAADKIRCKWLDVNGEAIFGSRYWIRSEDVSTQGIRVRYTTNKGNLYAVLLDTPMSQTLTIPGLILPKNAKIIMLRATGKLEWQQCGQNLFVTLPDMSSVKKSPAYTLKISQIPLS
ncbi:alpha-L-fucosidase C-terminal domain-containing protein [Nostoc sp. UHCC 0926]|uniref:alpha-L-fucosidase C-terminal domain-containing protein n=1 Tax=unclassified Nostoc TaxID=2593658 RepID=UPI00235F6301|nr:alpha-L-fucosidase C-terminal domain-containing protein [Nostoc sp. UHCC 0926]WDD34804.1 alpha-L-fucosidase C-terminal domain-containing protein [Nostoc sp. UHCC 0926]